MMSLNLFLEADSDGEPRQEEPAHEADNNAEPNDNVGPEPAPNPNKNLCRQCHTMFKLVDGTRTCMHEMLERDDSFVPDMEDGFLDIRDEHRRLYGTIAYARGLDTHPLRGQARVIHTLEAALSATGTMAAPEEESTTDEDRQEEETDNAETDNSTPEYQVLDEAPIAPTPGPSSPTAGPTFEDMLQAIRDAAARTNQQEGTPPDQQEGSPPGDWMLEAHTTQPTQATPDTDYLADDEEPSPFRTRTGYRGPLPDRPSRGRRGR